MNIKKAKHYLEKLEIDIKNEGEEYEKICCSSLVYILNLFLESLDDDK